MWLSKQKYQAIIDELEADERRIKLLNMYVDGLQEQIDDLLTALEAAGILTEKEEEQCFYIGDVKYEIKKRSK